MIGMIMFYGLAIAGVYFNSVPLSLFAIGIALSPEMRK